MSENNNDGGGEGEGEVLKPGDEGYVAPSGEGDGGEGEKGDQGDGSDSKETPAEKVARLKGSLKRALKDAGMEDEGEDNSNKKDKKGNKKSGEGDLDYGQKAFLIAKGIEDADEVTAVQNAMSESGKSLEQVLNSSWFKAELKELRDTKITANATPGNSKRSGQSAQNTPEYWMAKGELPPNTPENRELRQKVVDLRIGKEKKTGMFTDNPVVGK